MNVRPSLVAACLMAAFVLPAAAAPVTYVAIMDGPSEAPPNASPGTGSTTVVFDAIARTMRVTADFSGLIGTTTAAHIHCCTAAPFAGTVGVASMTPSFAGFPLGVTAGSMDETFDLNLAASWNPAFINNNLGTIEGALARLESGLAEGRAYFNIHSTFAGGGEIRGFLMPAPVVPVPASLLLLASGLAGLGGALRLGRRRTRAAAAR